MERRRTPPTRGQPGHRRPGHHQGVPGGQGARRCQPRRSSRGEVHCPRRRERRRQVEPGQDPVRVSTSPTRASCCSTAAPYRPRSPEDGLRAGVRVVYQELNLLTYMTVEENLLLRDPAVAPRACSTATELRRRAIRLLDEVGLDVPPGHAGRGARASPRCSSSSSPGRSRRTPRSSSSTSRPRRSPRRRWTACSASSGA